MAAEARRTRRTRSFDDVLDQLREAILSGRIRPGDRLPGERQLCESFGVGRPTLREALRSLEATGLIEVRPGKGGGSYAVLRRHEALVRPAVADEPLTVTIPDDIAAITAAIAAGNVDVARTRMRAHVEAWNRRTNG